MRIRGKVDVAAFAPTHVTFRRVGTQRVRRAVVELIVSAFVLKSGTNASGFVDQIGRLIGVIGWTSANVAVECVRANCFRCAVVLSGKTFVDH